MCTNYIMSIKSINSMSKNRYSFQCLQQTNINHQKSWFDILHRWIATERLGDVGRQFVTVVNGAFDCEMQFFCDGEYEKLLFSEECLKDVILRNIKATAIARWQMIFYA